MVAATGEQLAVPLLLTVTLSTLLLVMLLPATPRSQPRPVVPGRRLRYLRVLLRTQRFWQLVAFALLSGVAFEAVGSLSGSWLVDRGMQANGIATFRLISALLMASGAWLGGRMCDHRGANTVARWWLLILAASIAATALADLSSLPSVAVTLYATTYCAIGAFTASSYALFMNHANGPLAATVFSTFMGPTNACEAWSSKVAGALQVRSSYGTTMLLLAALSLLALPLLRSPAARRTRLERDQA